ncbi:MAG: anti-sigma factor [Schleiferiaceae bacterium]|nr:anti-sigma factor [Schleiferiaceae bacterium]
MNIKEYIASGILEEYVLDTCSEQERQEVACLSKIYPEIKAELHRLEEAFEGFLIQDAPPAPSHLWDAIEAQLPDRPAMQVVKESAPPASDSVDPPKTSQKKNTQYLVILTAAASIVLAFFVYRQSTVITQQEQLLTGQQRQIDTVQQIAREIELQYRSASRMLSSLYSPSNRLITLGAVPNNPTRLPNATALVSWNPESKEVLLSTGNLPAIPSDKQYQLWAIVDGTPTDLGVFDGSTAMPVLNMALVEAPQAFAITIEDFGGKPTPNLEMLVVIGEVS